MASTSSNEFELIGPRGDEKHQFGSDTTLSCHLSPEISAAAMEIRWFKGMDCICLYKNRQVTEGKGYEGRVNLFTHELQRGNVSLQIRDCTESDRGYYLCHVTNGDLTEELTVRVWKIPPSRDYLGTLTWGCICPRIPVPFIHWTNPFPVCGKPRTAVSLDCQPY
uniref:Ig-like domain-containing protein n=1 Tax=Pygocentrus nattereri TaxID=42514 RepID=A0A3B4C410_PYGNA